MIYYLKNINDLFDINKIRISIPQTLFNKSLRKQNSRIYYGIIYTYLLRKKNSISRF